MWHGSLFVVSIFVSHLVGVLCKECKISSLGGEYTGHVSTTETGRTCQRWDTQSPHSHSLTDPRMFPDDSLDDAANYCRNPDVGLKGPWCYTTDSSERWEFCEVDYCYEEFPDCKLTEAGVEYRGIVAETMSGDPCDVWEPADLPDETRDLEHNRCRNPDNKPEGPWCYYNNRQSWNYCDVSYCKVSAGCKNTEDGSRYVGTVSVTQSGLPCQRWDKQFPHEHNFDDDNDFPDATVADANYYCRNPDNKPGGLWCYTQEPTVEWDYCDINMCVDCKATAQGREYAGTVSQTASGLDCQQWSSQGPHQHDFTDSDLFPDASVADADNYCRNPDGRPGGPWCHTMEVETEWEYCDIPECSPMLGADAPLFRHARHVLHIGVDGLDPCFVDAPSGAPNIQQRLGQLGSYTAHGARAVLETSSAPNWMSHLCSSSMESTGVQSNSWKPVWKGYSAGVTPSTGDQIPFPNVFRAAKQQDAQVRTGALYDWMWLHYPMNYGDPGSVDAEYYCHHGDYGGGYHECAAFLASNATYYLTNIMQSAPSSYTFVYFGTIDVVGHDKGWCGEDYLDEVDYVDHMVGVLLDVIDEYEQQTGEEAFVILSSDHGGVGTGHGCQLDTCLLIPMYMRGPGVKVNHELKFGPGNQDMGNTALHVMGYKPSPWWKSQVTEDALI